MGAHWLHPGIRHKPGRPDRRLEFLGLSGVGSEPNADYAATIPHLAFAAYQMMFAIITPALITGAFVERVRFKAFLVFTVLWATFVYDPVAHWVWGVGGILRSIGALDFAGGTVVHITAGFSALAFAIVLGKRKWYGQALWSLTIFRSRCWVQVCSGWDGLASTAGVRWRRTGWPSTRW